MLNYQYFQGVEQKNVELSFSGERISSDGGLLLVREVNRQIGLIEQVSNCITDNRGQRYIDHTIEELVSQRACQIAAGYEDCNASDELRHDQIFKTCVGRLPQTGKDLGSQPTKYSKKLPINFLRLLSSNKAPIFQGFLYYIVILRSLVFISTQEEVDKEVENW